MKISDRNLTESLFPSLPDGWTLKKFKYLASVEKGHLPKVTTEMAVDGYYVPYLTMEYLRNGCNPQAYVSDDDDVVFANDGDILLLWDGSNAGEFLIAKSGVVSSTAALVRPRIIKPRYFFYACQATEAILREETVGMGIPHVNPEFLSSLRMPLPPERTQEQISDFLDRETARIDAFITAKERLLELLEEKRRAFITQAVTKGLDPNAPMRDSSVPWIGEIPKHWEIKRAKWLFKERDQRTENDEGELLTVSHITGVTPRSEKEVYMFEAETTEGYKICKPNDLVINTMWAWMGAMGISRVEGIVSPSYNVYAPLTRLFPEYVDLIVRTPLFKSEVVRHSKGVWSSRLRLYPEGLFEILFPVPTIQEQISIVNYMKSETQKTDSLFKVTQQTISLLKERRASLIAEAVTGKLVLV